MISRGVLETVEPVGVQTLIAESAVEALDEGVVDRLSRTAEMKIDSVGVSPLSEGIRNELRAVVDRDGARITVLRSEMGKRPNHSWAADASFHDDCGRSPGERVDERQNTE